MQPKVTISIPTFNSGKFLQLCLDAIKNQTYKNIEVNIIDGKSKDNTISIAQNMGIEPIIYTGALLGARDVGLKAAKGEYILLLDSDQILEATSIERAVEMIQTEALDMLVLEEDVYKNDTFIEKLFHYDRKLVHSVKDFNPYTSVMLPRFYKTNLLRTAFFHIPPELLSSVGGQDHAIIYFEVWNLSQKVNLLKNAVRHIEPEDLKTMWRKFYRWGHTSTTARIGKYQSLLKQKEHFRKGLFRKGMWTESVSSVMLLMIKGVPFKIGNLISRIRS